MTMIDVESIKSQINILDIVSEHVTLNSHHQGICPFHQETKPSFTVNPKEQYFHCFGCGEGGDVIRFLELMENKTFLEVIHDLAAHCGLELSAREADLERTQKTRTLNDIRSVAARYYAARMPADVKAHLTSDRKFTDETIRRFMIGYADGHLRHHLIDEKHLDPELCVEAGVLTNHEGSYRDFFYQRIIFPVISRGQIVNLTGRARGNQSPKYLHLPGKMNHLYNDDASNSKEVFIVEGPTDCISLEQAGYRAVALNGLALKKEHVDKFKLCETVYICVDGDDAGRHRVLTIADLIGDRARIITLPDGLDPNDFFREHRADDFTELIDVAQNPIEYEIGSIPSDTPPSELSRFLKPILTKLTRYDKARAEAVLKHQIASRFGLKRTDLDAYRSMMTQLRRESKTSQDKSDSTTESDLSALLPGLVDIVLDEGRPVFLMKENDELVMRDTVVCEGITFQPPDLHNLPFVMAEGQHVIEWYQEYRTGTGNPEVLNARLFDDLVDYHKSISEMPCDNYYTFIAAWDIHTYLQEKINFSPILCLFAEPERGKTRTGLGIVYVCYRGLHLESLREAYIFRAATYYQATLFFDVLDMWKKLDKSDSTDIILLRFQKGAKVARVLYPDKGAYKDIEYFEIFGPTIIGTNKPVDRILETRAIQINMPESSKRFDNEVTQEAALPLKARLLALRAYYLDEALPECEKPSKGRLGDILRPILQVVKLINPAAESNMMNFITELESTRKQDLSDSYEARIVRAISELDSKVTNGILPVKDITDCLNEDQPDHCKLKPNSLGWKLKSLGFQKRRTSDGSSGILYDEELITLLSRRYGLFTLPESGVISINSYDDDVPF